MPSVSARTSKQATAPKAKYHRIVLKISGEALKAKGGSDNISPEIVKAIGEQIRDVHALGVEVAVVIGGGNICAV